MEARANKVRRRSIRKARKQTRDRIRRNVRRKVAAKETAQQKREHPERESRLWKRGCEAVGPAAPGKRVVDIFDAGADAFELLDHEHANNRLYVLRAGKDRLLGGENAAEIEQVKRKLYEHVREVNAPEGVEPVEWILLTNVPVNSLEEAAERVDWYACRPIVEEFHKAQKTGCGIENPQFTS